ncbi:MAG: hypothetical protein RL215_2690 [Planctomycetota bacterium]
MAEDWGCEFLDIFDGDSGASVEECAGFGTEEEVLDGAGSCAPSEGL